MDQDRMNRQGQETGAMSRPTLAAVATLVAVTCGLAAFLVLGSSASTQAISTSSAAEVSQEKPITGTLSEPNYTVIALAADGLGKTDVSAADGSFSISPLAKKVTLHLRTPEGTYGGPIVLEEGWNVVKRAKKKLRQARKNLKRAKRKLKKAEGKAAKRKAKKKVKQARKKLKQAKKALKQARNRASGRRAILRLQAGAKLGSVTVRPAAGYAKAKLTERQWNRWVVEKTQAQAKDGVPIGAGNFGRVRSSQLTGSGVGDLDRDGVSDPLDIDDDGDLVLDDVDASAAGPAATTAQQAAGELQTLTAVTAGGPGGTPIVNANAPGLSDEQIKSAAQARATLSINTLGSEELDCGELIYCSAGGTGFRDRFGNPIVQDPNPESFPECCDPDGDGLGSLDSDGTTLLKPGTGADQVRGGDVLIARDEVSELSGTLRTSLVTLPAIAYYVDELGTRRDVSYPLTFFPCPVEPDECPKVNPLGIDPSPPLPVVDGPDADSDVEVTLHFWRPQRRPIPDELPPGVESNWIDIGGMQHWAQSFSEPPGLAVPRAATPRQIRI